MDAHAGHTQNKINKNMNFYKSILILIITTNISSKSFGEDLNLTGNWITADQLRIFQFEEQKSNLLIINLASDRQRSFNFKKKKAELIISNKESGKFTLEVKKIDDNTLQLTETHVGLTFKLIRLKKDVKSLYAESIKRKNLILIENDSISMCLNQFDAIRVTPTSFERLNKKWKFKQEKYYTSLIIENYHSYIVNEVNDEYIEVIKFLHDNNYKILRIYAETDIDQKIVGCYEITRQYNTNTIYERLELYKNAYSEHHFSDKFHEEFTLKFKWRKINKLDIIETNYKSSNQNSFYKIEKYKGKYQLKKLKEVKGYYDQKIEIYELNNCG